MLLVRERYSAIIEGVSVLWGSYDDRIADLTGDKARIALMRITVCEPLLLSPKPMPARNNYREE